MNLANKITMFRVICIPLFIVLMYMEGDAMRMAALVVFLVASVSDFIDGYVARHYNQVSDFGKFMDPLADKMLVITAMLMLVEVGRMPAWVCIIAMLYPYFSSAAFDTACSIIILVTTLYSGIEYFVVNRDVMNFKDM